LANCDNENSINNILLISFQSSCDNDCAVAVMERAGIAENSYDHLESLGIITLNEHTEDELMILRNDNENVNFIECDGIVSIQSSPIELANCDNENSINNILLISFQSSCDNDCAVAVMERASIAENSYVHLKSLNMITLNKFTEDELAILRNNNENVNSIECDGIFSIDDTTADASKSSSASWLAWAPPFLLVVAKLLF